MLMKKQFKNILIIIQRSNGDVFFSSGLISSLHDYYPESSIDLLVNDDTYAIAKLLPYVKNIITFSYDEKKRNRLHQEKTIIRRIFKKYDLSICLTASDRSVLYSSLASNFSISAIEKDYKKSWWKRLALKKSYFFDTSKHILINNYQALDILNIDYKKVHPEIKLSEKTLNKVKTLLNEKRINEFLIFHPSAQYEYKIYPKKLRDKLFELLSSLNFSIVVTGGSGYLDKKIEKELPKNQNIHSLIGATSLEDYFAISYLSSGYIGMDTLNMHIAASQNKKIFAIFGPTNIRMWSPWSNISQRCASKDQPIQSYDNIKIFQADLPCVACGKAGCDDNHGRSECLNMIDPKTIFCEIKNSLI